MENWLLSDKDKNIDTEWLVQNIEQLFESVATLLKSKDEKIISKVCIKLTNLYKDKELKHENLIINCIPILLNYYFNYFYDEKICPIIEVCILTIYNLSLTDENVKINRIRVPNLSVQSIYHSPLLSSTQFELTESALGKYESEYAISEEHFKPYLDTNNAEKRFSIIKFLLILYYSRLVNIIKASKVYFCDMCLKMCKITRQSSPIQPIYLNSDILIEMLHALFYLFNNNLQLDAYIAIEAITVKAEEELLVDVILICNSIKNIIKIEPSLQNVLNSESILRHNNANSQSSGGLQTKISTSLSFTRKKSLDPLTTTKIDSPSELFPNSTESTLNEVYISPNCEIRKEAKRASVKIQQQQQQKSAEYNIQQQEELEKKRREKTVLEQALETAKEAVPPPPPDCPPPSLYSVDSINKADDNNENIPSIDEASNDEQIEKF